MGRLINGDWTDRKHLITSDDDGEFRRPDSVFRDWIRADGSTRFAPEVGRYHLYVSKACPWAHRVRAFRVLKGLEEVISISGVEPLMLESGWEFSDRYPDPLHDDTRYLYQIYQRARRDVTGRATVPVLWDRKTQTIVNNESSEIIRMMNSEFGDLGATDRDYYPEPLRDEIDEVNERVYQTVNNGVYRCGFARKQAAYDRAVGELFDTLDWLEARLEGRDYLVGDQPTEADWRLYPTLVRFDAVYHGHFKCNLRRLRDYPNLLAHTRRLHAEPGIAELVDIDYIKTHYYGSHRSINPTGIVPAGPAQLLD